MADAKARRRLIGNGLVLCLAYLSACGGGTPTAAPERATSSTAPSTTIAAPTTTAPRPINYFERAQGQLAEVLLGQTNFGYTDDQIGSLKATYGEDLSAYRHTLLAGEPTSQDSVTTIFDFSGKLNEQGFRTMIQNVRRLAGTRLVGIDPMRDGSSLAAEIVLNELSKPKVVVIGKDPQSIPSPTWNNQPSGFGVTNFRNYNSFIPSASFPVNIQETIWRELTYRVAPGPNLGPKLSKVGVTSLGTSVGESVGNSISGAVDRMVNGKLGEGAAKAAVLARPGVKYGSFDDLIYGADLSGISLAGFADTTLFIK